RQVEVLAHGETGRLQAGPDDLVGGAGVGRGLQDDERAGPQVGGDVLDGGVHRAEVGRAVLGERGGHADDDGGGVGDHLGPVGRREAPSEHRGDLGVRDVVHVGAAGVQTLDDVAA